MTGEIPQTEADRAHIKELVEQVRELAARGKPFSDKLTHTNGRTYEKRGLSISSTRTLVPGEGLNQWEFVTVKSDGREVFVAGALTMSQHFKGKPEFFPTTYKHAGNWETKIAEILDPKLKGKIAPIRVAQLV